MPDLDEKDEKTLFERLKELGPEAVREMLARGDFPTNLTTSIRAWIAHQARRPPGVK